MEGHVSRAARGGRLTRIQKLLRGANAIPGCFIAKLDVRHGGRLARKRLPKERGGVYLVCLGSSGGDIVGNPSCQSEGCSYG